MYDVSHMLWFEAASDATFTRWAMEKLLEYIPLSIQRRGQCVIGLSGGSTPKPVYVELGRNETIDWSKVWVFLVDDRHVAADHPDSNQHLVHTTLNAGGKIAADHMIFPDTTLPIDECVRDYEERLRPLLDSAPADIVTLGMGDDGHTASLFPPLPDAAFGKHLIIHTTTEKFAVRERISVTMPVLKAAAHRLIFLKGGNKKSTWHDMMNSDDDERRWPMKGVMDERTAVIYCP